MAKLLENTRHPNWRIWAVEAPFYHKDTLRAPGHRWNGEVNGHPKAWYIDVAKEAQAAECAFLCKSIYGRLFEPVMHKFTAYERSPTSIRPACEPRPNGCTSHQGVAGSQIAYPL